jgi:hypothetical protein
MIEFLDADYKRYYGKNNQYKKYVLNWFGPDSEKNYLDTCEKNPNWIYKDVKITYELNYCFFRTDNFDEIDWNNSILMLGCSFVFGIGLTNESTMPYRLQELTGHKVINLGMPAASNTRIWSLLINILNSKIKPKAIIIVWSDPNRYTEFNDDGMEDFQPGTGHLKEKSELAYYYLTHETQSVEMSLRYIISSKIMCSDIPYFAYSWYPNSMLDKQVTPFANTAIERDRARDNSHYGPYCNNFWANQIYNDIRGII